MTVVGEPVALGPEASAEIRHLGVVSRPTATKRFHNYGMAGPAPIVAELLGYSYITVQRHAEIAAQPWARTSPKQLSNLN